jgi:SOS-response transcriptional repressor LexA
MMDDGKMTREETRRENARRLASKVGGKKEFANFLGMEPSQVSQLIGPNPVKNIGNSIAQRIEKAFDLPAGYLDVEHPEFGQGSSDDGEPLTPSKMPFIGNATRVTVGAPESEDTIPVKKVKLSLQAGFPAFEADVDFEDGGLVNLPRRFVEANDLIPNCLIAIRVRGASMEPMFFEDDVVVVNIADNKPVSGAIYAINFNGQAVVKQMVKSGQDWWLHSFNPADEYRRVLCRGGECIVIGKIVHQGARSLIGRT